MGRVEGGASNGAGGAVRDKPEARALRVREAARLPTLGHVQEHWSELPEQMRENPQGSGEEKPDQQHGNETRRGVGRPHRGRESSHC